MGRGQSNARYADVFEAEDDRSADQPGEGSTVTAAAIQWAGFRMVKWIKAIEFVHDISAVGEGEGGYDGDHEYFGELANI